MPRPSSRTVRLTCVGDRSMEISTARFGAAVHVSERFLGDAEQGEFHFLGEALEIVGDGEIHHDAASLGEEPDVGTETDGKAGLVHKRRMQNRGNRADFADGVAGERAARFCEFAGAQIVLRKRIFDLFQSHFQGSQGLRGGFVKFAGHAALFFATQGQELARKPAQVVLNALLFGNVVIETDETSELP
jgi:hypothetical protein